MALPKKHIEHTRLRTPEVGNKKRRRNLKNILDDSINFPKGVVLKDIDQAFDEWVKKDLYITFDGEELPTFKLFSNQRLSEYAQNWQHTDSLGNVLMNFKAITRENNPKKGNNQGSIFNIPGDRDYVIGYKPVLLENGQEAYDMYTMKQPYTLDLLYTVTLITNKYELLNKMNQLIQSKFSALQCYLFPNGHAMPMKLEDVSDESEYDIGDRKYYSQSYKIDLLAYIVEPDGFKITHLPSRLKFQVKPKDKHKNYVPVKIKVEDWSILDECESETDNRYSNQNITVNIDFPSCHKQTDFTFDSNMSIEEIELNNICDFVFYINGEYQEFEADETDLLAGDKVHIEIERSDAFKESSLIIKGKSKDVILDNLDDPESSLDEKNFDMNIEIKNGEF